jgi:hypothetical protein
MANTLLIEGTFEELSEELAVYIDGLGGSSVQSEIAPLLKDGNKVDALKKMVTASSVLNSAPEKGESYLFFLFLVLFLFFPSVLSFFSFSRSFLVLCSFLLSLSSLSFPSLSSLSLLPKTKGN